MLTNKETISRLKFIGKIEINDKIDLKNMSITHDGLYTQISRTIFQDNRTKTLVFLQDTVNKAFEIIKCYEKSQKNSDKRMCYNIINDLLEKTNLDKSICIHIGLDKRKERAIDQEYYLNLEKLKEYFPNLEVIVNESETEDPIVTAPENFIQLIDSVKTLLVFLN